MKGLLTKDFLTIKKKYGLPRVIMDIAIIIALMFILEKSGTIYISFLLIPIEIMSMIISLTTCDEQWKWGKYAVSLPVSKKQIVCSRYACAGILSLIGFVVALIVNSASYILFPQYAYGFYLFMSCASFALTLLFLAFVLPSNYSLGVNAGFATMFILIILLVVLGLWTKNYVVCCREFWSKHCYCRSFCCCNMRVVFCTVKLVFQKKIYIVRSKKWESVSDVDVKWKKIVL